MRRHFSASTKALHAAGYELRRIQRGLMPTDWKPLPSVGQGVNEIRIHTDVEHRVMYVAKLKRRSTCCTLSRKEAGRLVTQISPWHVSASSKLKPCAERKGEGDDCPSATLNRKCIQ
jgi:putative component of toxin-antitoxin plasmid stabilization module